MHVSAFSIQYVCLSVISIPLPKSQVQSPHDEGGVIVFDSAPSFQNEKEDFLFRHGKRGKGECVSDPVFLCSGSHRATVPLFTECNRFTETTHPNKAHTDLCQVT